MIWVFKGLLKYMLCSCPYGNIFTHNIYYGDLTDCLIFADYGVTALRSHIEIECSSGSGFILNVYRLNPVTVSS